MIFFNRSFNSKIAHLPSDFFLSIFLVSCAKSPTGRSTIKLYSSNQLDQMGTAGFFDSLKKETPLSNKRTQNLYVACVANQITEQVPKSKSSLAIGKL